MKTITIHFKSALVLSFSALLFACAGVSPKAYFYTLNSPESAADNTVQNDSVHASMRIQIMPISIDETVDRPQIVVTNAQHQVQFLEQQRWAQPLKYEIGRVVGEHLNQRIPDSIVSAYPHQLSNPNLQLSLQIIAFESSYTTPAKVKVNYTLINIKTKQTVSQTKEYAQALAGGIKSASTADIIEAHSKNILQLSQDITLAIHAIYQ